MRVGCRIAQVAMKRRATKLILFLLLGAILNVAVAWGCAVVVDLEDVPQANVVVGWIFQPRPRGDIYLERRQVPGAGRVRSWVNRTTGTSLAMIAGPSPTPIKGPATCKDGLELLPSIGGRLITDETNVIIDWRGWPFRSMWCQINPAAGVGASNASATSRSGSGLTISHWPGQTANVVLPLNPIWPGFAINAIFYAAILWLPFAALGAVRRRRRMKRRLCTKCAYDLRGRASENKLCPECGGSASKSS